MDYLYLSQYTCYSCLHDFIDLGQESMAIGLWLCLLDFLIGRLDPFKVELHVRKDLFLPTKIEPYVEFLPFYLLNLPLSGPQYFPAAIAHDWLLVGNAGEMLEREMLERDLMWQFLFLVAAP